MRWGGRDEATDDHMTTELCMNEIRNCQRRSTGPNFVVFFVQAEDGIRDYEVTGVQTCALPICSNGFLFKN